MQGATVELSMIVRDGVAGLERCLRSVAGLVDRIVAGDTGSTDGSVEVARAFGAEVFPLAWTEDFSHARNQVLARARCDWVLVLDADEMLDADAGEGLRAVLEQDVLCAYDVERWNYVAETNSRSGEHGARVNPHRVEAAAPYPAYVTAWNTRLFRRREGIVFERPVHESVVASLNRLGLRRGIAPFVIHHFGHVEDEKGERRHKNELYQRIGERHHAAHPDHARTSFELGLGELEHFRRPAAALRYFHRALRAAPEDGAAWLFRGVSLLRLGHLEQALATLERSEAMQPECIVLQETVGDAHFHLKQYGQAAAHYQRARELGSASALVQAKLGASLIHLNRTQEGLAMVHDAVRREPGFAELVDVARAAATLAGLVR